MHIVYVFWDEVRARLHQNIESKISKLFQWGESPRTHYLNLPLLNLLLSDWISRLVGCLQMLFLVHKTFQWGECPRTHYLNLPLLNLLLSDWISIRVSCLQTLFLTQSIWLHLLPSATDIDIAKVKCISAFPPSCILATISRCKDTK